MLVHNEQVVHEYLQWAMCGTPRPKGQFKLYAVEGGTAAVMVRSLFGDAVAGIAVDLVLAVVSAALLSAKTVLHRWLACQRRERDAAPAPVVTSTNSTTLSVKSQASRSASTGCSWS